MGLWFGRSKPKLNTFLLPFVNECKSLEEEGFLFPGESVSRKVFALVCSSDSPVRTMLRNCKQFNGKFGCDWCEHENVAVTQNSSPPIRYYPQRGYQRARTSEEQSQYGALTELEQDAVQGVKGLSVIDILPTFDTVKGFTPEYMHSVCQGVIRQGCNIWLDSSNHQKEFYLGRKVEKLDERLTTISPPSEITRAPRSVKERKFWKASEWRAFLLYSPIILQGLLPSVYLKHFFLLVHAVFTLLGDKISSNMLLHARASLVKFVTEMEVLYGLHSCTFNVHILTHLTDGVKNCGPLWATSAYIFEANNHMLIKMFNGTQYVPRQICKTFLLSQKLPAIARQYIKEDTSPRVRNSFQKLSKGNLPLKSERILQDNVSGLGSCKPTCFTASQVIALESLTNRDVVNQSAVVYDRFVVNHVLYTSQNYTRAKRHRDDIVKIDHLSANYGRIMGLYTAKPECSCSNDELQQCNCTVYNVVILKVFNCESGTPYSDAECSITAHFLKESTQINSWLNASNCN